VFCLAGLSWLSYLNVFPGFPVLDELSWLSLSWLSLSWLSSPGRPVLAFLAWLSYLGSPASISLTFCHYNRKQLGLLPMINQMVWIFFMNRAVKTNSLNKSVELFCLNPLHTGCKFE
jgi:hypothetical protein